LPTLKSINVNHPIFFESVLSHFVGTTSMYSKSVELRHNDFGLDDSKLLSYFCKLNKIGFRYDWRFFCEYLEQDLHMYQTDSEIHMFAKLPRNHSELLSFLSEQWLKGNHCEQVSINTNVAPSSFAFTNKKCI
jgi:hypothetical protein